MRFEHRFRRGGTLNEDALPGQADEIVGYLRLETVMPAGPFMGPLHADRHRALLRGRYTRPAGIPTA